MWLVVDLRIDTEQTRHVFERCWTMCLEYAKYYRLKIYCLVPGVPTLLETIDPRNKQHLEHGKICFLLQVSVTFYKLLKRLWGLSNENVIEQHLHYKNNIKKSLKY